MSLGEERYPCSAECGNKVSYRASVICTSCHEKYCIDCTIPCPASKIGDSYHGNGWCEGHLCINCMKNKVAEKCECCKLLVCCMTYMNQCKACLYCDDGIYDPKDGTHKFGIMHGSNSNRDEAYESYRKVLDHDS